MEQADELALAGKGPVVSLKALVANVVSQAYEQLQELAQTNVGKGDEDRCSCVILFIRISEIIHIKSDGSLLRLRT